MARNKAYDIVAFEGGLNTHADARDIEDNQVSELVNLLSTNKGVLKAGYSNIALSTSLYPTNGSNSTYGEINSKNIYEHKTDFSITNANSFTEYLLLTTGRELYRLEYLNNAWVWTKILDFSFSAGQSFYPIVNIYDGHIRYSDGSFTLNANSPYLPLNKTLFYGQVRRKYFTASENTVSTITGNASIIKPTDGKINFNKDVEITANRPTQGYLGLEVSKINNTILDGVSFGTDQAPTNPTESNSGNYSSYDTMAINDEVTVLGESVTVINNDATTSVMRDMQVNKDYLLSAIATAQGGLASQVSFNSNGGYLEVGNGSSGESVDASFFITLDDKSNSHNFGTTRRSLRINGAFFQGGSSVTYSYLDYEPNVYPVSEDGTVGSELTILTGNDANGNPNKDDNQTNFACFRFEDSTQALKYKVVLKAGNNEQIRVESLQIFQSLAPVTNDGTLAKFARLTISGTAQSSGIRFEFNNIFSTSLQTPDSIMFVRIAIPSGNVRSGTSEYSPTKINFYFSTSPDHDNYRLFTLGTDWINQNKSKGWIDVPIDLSQISEIVGTANIGEIDCFQVELFKDNFSAGSYHDLFIDQVAQIEDKRGTWDGYYKFYYSWIYDRNQESSFFEFPNQAHGIPLSLNQIETKVLIKELSNGGFGARGRRITGANVYYAEFDEVNEIPKYTDPFYLMSCDFERGVKKPNSQSLETWSLGTTATDHYTHVKTSFINPEISSTFSINSGYVYNPLDSIEELRFRASAVLNRRIYYGNVDIVWEKASGETNAKYNRYGDRIYKSLPNKPDMIPSYNFLDVDVNDGDEITALESYADRLLVFKKDIMYIVNATQEMEYLEDTHKHKGVYSNESIVKTDMGIAWANRNGCFHYDGEKVVDLSKEKIDSNTWGTHVGFEPRIVFDPKDRHLLMVYKNSATGLVYNFNKESFSKSTRFIGTKNTNLIYYKDQIIQADIDDSNDDLFTFSKMYLDYANNATINFQLKTKDFALNEIGGKVDIKSIYLTYKGTTASSGSQSVVASYYANKSTVPTALTNGTLVSSPNGYTTVQLIPNPKTGGRSVFSIQLQIASSGGYRNIEIHDISIVYREKSLK